MDWIRNKSLFRVSNNDTRANTEDVLLMYFFDNFEHIYALYLVPHSLLFYNIESGKSLLLNSNELFY